MHSALYCAVLVDGEPYQRAKARLLTEPAHVVEELAARGSEHAKAAFGALERLCDRESRRWVGRAIARHAESMAKRGAKTQGDGNA